MSDNASGTTTAKTMIESVYAELREEILAGKYPPASKLKVEQLRSAYNVSSSTMREALSRLVSDTLVTTEGQRGFRVAPLSVRDFRQIAEMRKLLESRALRESIEQGDEEWEACVVAAFYRLSRIEEALAQTAEKVDPDWDARNQAFHNALISACDNDWLLRFRDILHHQSSRYLRIALVDTSSVRDVHAEHEAITKAALARDADKACHLIEMHITRTVDVIAAKVVAWEADD